MSKSLRFENNSSSRENNEMVIAHNIRVYPRLF